MLDRVFPGVSNMVGAEVPACQPDPRGCALPIGTRLNEFEVERVLGAGGFGIVYLALDHSLMRQVAIKEYFPALIASRGTDLTLRVRVATDAVAFAAGLRSFLNEARLLAGFDHASLVKVHRYWEANGTAYMVMPYYAGRTLKQARQEMASPPSEAWLRSVLEPLLGALELLHSQSIYHRDVSPDNVMLLPDGRPVLLDFGSARRVAVGDTTALTAVVKPNFAPVEQYADMAKVPQGPWTDLYAVGAVAHFLVYGEAPTPAVMRAIRDDSPLLASDESSPCSLGQPFAAAMDWALAIDPCKRPQSVAELLSALNGERAAPRPSVRTGVRSSPSQDADSWRTTFVEPVAPAAPSIETPVLAVAPGPAEQQATQRRRGSLHAAMTIAIVAIGALAFVGYRLGDRGPSSESSMNVAAPGLAKPGKALTNAIPAATAATGRPSRSALDVCADKHFLLRTICARRACEQPQLRLHAECVRMRKQDEERIRADSQR